MTEQRKENIMKYWPLVVGILMLAGTWAGIQSHMSNDAIHLNQGERILTEDQFNNLMRFSAIMKEKAPYIDRNRERIIIIERKQAVGEVKYEIVYSEIEGLEDKVSREVSKLNDKINELRN